MKKTKYKSPSMNAEAIHAPSSFKSFFGTEGWAWQGFSMDYYKISSSWFPEIWPNQCALDEVTLDAIELHIPVWER
jgi:hypothetical protein